VNFRSRLEARWAVFFDALGEEWQYEVEGFELPSGRYLPDFYLPKRKTYVEVKPGPGPKPVYVYMAGRIGPTHYRPFSISGDAEGDSESVASRIIPLCGIHFRYVGPFSGDSDNHDALHGGRPGYEDARGAIFARSIRGIEACDIFFALFEDHEAFGTLIELGVAKAKGKRIVVGIADTVPDGYPCHDLWFAEQCADKILTGTREAILAAFSSWLFYQGGTLSREQVLAVELRKTATTSVTVVYNDPVSAFDDGSGVSAFHRPDSPPLWALWLPHRREAAALKARQARFEHGQSGALA